MDTPLWALSLAYWIHMVATVVWIGGLTSLAVIVLPSARRSLDLDQYAALIGAIQRRLDPIGWFCLALLAGTGMVQMSANPNYQGFLAVNNRWAIAILIKHLLFLGMAGLSAYLSWGLLPKLRRLALLQNHAAKKEPVSKDEFGALQKQENRLMQINLVLGVFILALTAVARAV